MPTYTIKDHQTGRTIKVRGDSRPTDAEIEQLFKDNAPGPAATSGIPPAPHSDANPLSDSAPDTYSQVDRTSAMLDPLAAPNTMGDFAGLLLPNFAGVGSAMTNAAAPAVKWVGEATEGLGSKIAPFTRRGFLPGALVSPKAAFAAQLVPPTLKGSGRILQRTGRVMEAAPLDSAMFKVDLGPAATPPRLGLPPHPDESFVRSMNAQWGEQPSLGPGATRTPPPADPSFVRGVAADVENGLITGEPVGIAPMASHGPVMEGEIVNPFKQLEQGARPMPPGADPSFVRGVPAELATVERPTPAVSHAPAILPAKGETTGPFEMGGDVIDYTGDRPVPRGAAPVGTLEETALKALSDSGIAPVASHSQPLGMPRVLSWKEGHGPTVEDVQRAREFGGSKNAASRLKIPQKQVQQMAPRTGPATLPPEAQSRIRDQFSRMSADEQQAYLAGAPNELSRAYIESLLK